jgi:hypothetical protein
MVRVSLDMRAMESVYKGWGIRALPVFSVAVQSIACKPKPHQLSSS